MAITAKLYAPFPENALGGDAAGDTTGPIDILSDTVNVALTGSGHVIAQSDAVYADISADELAASGNYSTGGAALGTKTYAVSSLVTTFDAADTVWSSATFSADNAHVWVATKLPLISYVDFDGTQTVSTADFTIQWNASGIFTITVA